MWAKGPERDAEIVRLNGLGYRDPEIGELVGLTSGGVKSVRVRLDVDAVPRGSRVE